MIDFHCHFLPGMDDGAETPEIAYEMLCMSARQGVKAVVATPHFYPSDESPEEFLRRREDAVNRLRIYVHQEREKGDRREVPSVYLGAEVYYFPTIGNCGSIPKLAFGHQHFLLVEPPMAPWSKAMLSEIELISENFDVTPVIAHADRYMRILEDKKIFDLLEEREIPVQVNASFFFRKETADYAMKKLKAGKICLLGSDAHDLEYRPPNMASAVEAVSIKKMKPFFDQMIADQNKMMNIQEYFL